MTGVRGILTDDDRDYLRNRQSEKYGDNEGQKTTQKRYRLRRKLAQSFRDFTDIRLLAPDDEKLLFQNLDSEGLSGIEKMLTFVFQGIGRYTTVDLETFVEQALRKAVVDITPVGGPTVDEVTVEVEYVDELDPEHVRQKFEAGKRLTDRELGVLVRTTDVTFEQLGEWLGGDVPKAGSANEPTEDVADGG